MSPEAIERAEQEFGYAPTYQEAVQQQMHPHEEQQQQQAEQQQPLPDVMIEGVAE